MKALSEIATPALVVDVPAMERNIARMAGFFAEGTSRLRPHFKAHKTPEIARRQLAAPATIGLTCATVVEAEVAASFCHDILLANEIVTPDKARRAAAVASRVRLTVAVDSRQGIDALAQAARSSSSNIGVVVDVNVGQNRCGIAPGEPALELAFYANETSGVALRGVMGYEGHVQPIVDREARATSARAAMLLLVRTAELIKGNDLPCDIVSAGGTGTYDISGRIDGVTEIQAGSYVVMDSDYGRLDLPFEQALFVLGTIVSRPVADRVVADCGHKACSKDHGLPTIVGHEGAIVVSLNDEHATITVPPDSTLAVGDRIRLRPSHVDPTVNLHEVIYALDGDAVVAEWDVAARGWGLAPNP